VCRSAAYLSPPERQVAEFKILNLARNILSFLQNLEKIYKLDKIYIPLFYILDVINQYFGKMEYKLDKKDKKILFELDMDARQTSAMIGKKVGLSKEVVNYRIRRLENEKIIMGYYSVIDTLKLGYLVGTFFIKLHGINNGKHKELVDYCVAHPKIGWVVLVEGTWSLGLVMFSKDIKEIHEAWTGLQMRFGTYIDKTTITFSVRAVHFRNTFLYGMNDGKKMVLGDGQRKTIDEKDMVILKHVAMDGRISINELSKKTRIAPANARFRLNKLVKDQVINGFRAAINLHSLGYMYYKVVLYLNNYTPEQYKRLCKYIALHPNVTILVELMAPFALELSVVVRNTREIYDFISGIKGEFSDLIKSHKSGYASQFMKLSYF
jgi:DNA-binding Lrp family transcriptional regulator